MVNRGTVARANRYLRNEPNFCLKYQTFACKFLRAITEQEWRSSPGVRLRLQGRVNALAPCGPRARASSISFSMLSGSRDRRSQMIGDAIEEMGVSVIAPAKELGVTRQQLHNLIAGRCGITPEMAYRLEQAVGSTADTWLRMQANLESGANPHPPHIDQGQAACAEGGVSSSAVRLTTMTAGKHRTIWSIKGVEKVRLPHGRRTWAQPIHPGKNLGGCFPHARRSSRRSPMRSASA